MRAALIRRLQHRMLMKHENTVAFLKSRKLHTINRTIWKSQLPTSNASITTIQRRKLSVTNNSKKPRILITGAIGQIGTELVTYLRDRYDNKSIIASDVKMPSGDNALLEKGPFVYMDVTDYSQIARIVVEYRINCVIHLAALISAVGEKNPQLAMKVNNLGTENVLEVARVNELKVYVPSTIAAFGPSTPRVNTPNMCVMRPTTVYGITKVYNELLGEYYCRRYGVDFRSLRYPGIISNKAMPGGGTTDYAVEIYHEAIKNKSYNCFLKDDTMLPMMYMPDCLKATCMMLEADSSKLKSRVYNVTAISFTPKQVYDSIKKYIPDMKIEYKPDFRQAIADSWPKSIDDTEARNDWDWKPEYDLDFMTKDMLDALRKKYIV